MIDQERRSVEDRRKSVASPLFPFFDSEDTLVRQDRRQIPERRVNNIIIEESDNGVLDVELSEIGNKRLFIWFQDEIHEIKREGDGVWIGRSSDCLATFSSMFISRKHAQLCFQENAYYLTDDSVNGTYIKNDDGEIFITKDKIMVKGSGVISLGVPFDHSESEVIHYFIG